MAYFLNSDDKLNNYQKHLLRHQVRNRQMDNLPVVKSAALLNAFNRDIDYGLIVNHVQNHKKNKIVNDRMNKRLDFNIKKQDYILRNFLTDRFPNDVYYNDYYSPHYKPPNNNRNDSESSSESESGSDG